MNLGDHYNLPPAWHHFYSISLGHDMPSIIIFMQDHEISPFTPFLLNLVTWWKAQWTVLSSPLNDERDHDLSISDFQVRKNEHPVGVLHHFYWAENSPEMCISKSTLHVSKYTFFGISFFGAFCYCWAIVFIKVAEWLTDCRYCTGIYLFWATNYEWGVNLICNCLPKV